jgi:Tfp pilus assembly protein PilX
MSFTIQLKRSSTTGHSPSLTGNSALQYGELSINTTDGLLYFVSNSTGSNAIVCIGQQPSVSNALTTPRNITLTGDITGSVSFSGNANVSLTTTLATAPFSTGTSGYQKMPSGIITQFGTGTLVSGSNTITFPTSFPTACQSIVVSSRGTAVATQSPIFAGTPSTTGCTIYSATGATYTFTYIAIGY